MICFLLLNKICILLLDVFSKNRAQIVRNSANLCEIVRNWCEIVQNCTKLCEIVRNWCEIGANIEVRWLGTLPYQTPNYEYISSLSTDRQYMVVNRGPTQPKMKVLVLLVAVIGSFSPTSGLLWPSKCTDEYLKATNLMDKNPASPTEAGSVSKDFLPQPSGKPRINEISFRIKSWSFRIISINFLIFLVYFFSGSK